MPKKNKFLGRCATCLDNASLDDSPCRLGHGPGMPSVDDDCLVRKAQAAHREKSDA